MTSKTALLFLPFFYGFLTLTFQAVFIRQLVSFYGASEINYAVIITLWMILTGLGAWMFEKIFVSRKASFKALFSMTLLGAVSPLLLLISNNFIGLVCGYDISLSSSRIYGFTTVALASLFVMSPLCLLSGAVFTGIVRKMTAVSEEQGLASAYIVEALGALTAGILMSLLIFQLFEDYQVLAGMVVIALAVASTAILLRWFKLDLAKKTAYVTSIIVIAVFTAIYFQSFEQVLYHNRNRTDPYSTPYQMLSSRTDAGQLTVFSNGVKRFTTPDRESAELVHLVLWQKASFERIAVIGLPSPDLLHELLKYSQAKIDIYEIDRDYYDYIRSHLNSKTKSCYQDRRLTYFWGDPHFRFLNSDRACDFILVNVGDPQGISSNRYFTHTFYERSAKLLKAGGILAFETRGSGNLLRKNLKAYLSSLAATLKSVFPDLAVIPAERYIFMASNENISMDIDVDLWLRNKRFHDINTVYVDSVYLEYLNQPFKLMEIEQVLADTAGQVNRSLRPIVYYFNMILHAEMFRGFEQGFMLFFKNHPFAVRVLYVLPALPLLLIMLRRRKAKLVSGAYLAGFAGMLMQITVIVMFQALFSNIFSRIALLNGLFMFGLAVGGYLPIFWESRKVRNPLRFAFSLMLSGILMFIFAIVLSQAFADSVRQILILLLAVISGGFSGCLFNLSAVAYRKRFGSEIAGAFYFADLIGGALAGAVVATVTIPLAGVYSSLYIMITVVVTYIILNLSFRNREERRSL